MNASAEQLRKFCLACIRNDEAQVDFISERLLVEFDLSRELEFRLVELRHSQTSERINAALLVIVNERLIDDYSLRIEVISNLGLSRRLNLTEAAKLIAETPRDSNTLLTAKERRILEVCNLVLMDLNEGRMNVTDDDLLRVELRRFIIKSSGRTE